MSADDESENRQVMIPIVWAIIILVFTVNIVTVCHTAQWIQNLW